MKKLSRYLAVLLIVLMFASMAVSCKKGPADDESGVADTDNGEGSSTEGGNTEGGDDGKGGTSTDGKDNNNNNNICVHALCYI